MTEYKQKIFIFTGPSGCGKTSIAKELLKLRSHLENNISACTRDKRGRTEEYGVDYYFLTPQNFKERIDNNEFIEWEEVYEGNFYGTLKSEVKRLSEAEKDIVFVVDIKGAIKLKEYFGNKCTTIFIQPPSLEELGNRLRLRKTDSEDSISRRLFKAKFEMTFADKFDNILINNEFSDSIDQCHKIINEFLKDRCPFCPDGIVEIKEEELEFTYLKNKIKFLHLSHHCTICNEYYTTTELDDINVDRAKIAYDNLSKKD